MNAQLQRTRRLRTRAAVAMPPWYIGAALAIVLAGSAAPAGAGTLTLNFETPPFPTTAQPDNFNAAGAMQTYTQAGVFSITGGVVLGNPTFLPEFATNGTPPNLYGTTDVADPSLLSTITLSLDASLGITSVTGVLFNGQNTVASGNAESYTITAYSGANAVDTLNPSLSTDLTSSGSLIDFSLSSTLSAPITEVTFTTPNAGVNGWDFLVDTIVAQGTALAVPEPSTTVMGATALLVGVACGWRRRRMTRA